LSAVKVCTAPVCPDSALIAQTLACGREAAGVLVADFPTSACPAVQNFAAPVVQCAALRAQDLACGRQTACVIVADLTFRTAVTVATQVTANTNTV